LLSNYIVEVFSALYSIPVLHVRNEISKLLLKSMHMFLVVTTDLLAPLWNFTKKNIFFFI